jgi:MraZ protein
MVSAVRNDVEVLGETASSSAGLSLTSSRGRTSTKETVALAPAVPVMTGTHFHALDEKGRVIIPSKLRPALTEQFWMMLDHNDNVAIYNYQTGLDVFAHCESMIAEHPGDDAIAAAVEDTLSCAELVTAEGNWRVQVSEMLRFHAGLDKEVVTVGVLNHAVIWSREKWQAVQERRDRNDDVRRVQAELLRAATSRSRNGHEQARAVEVENRARQERQEQFTAATRRAEGAFSDLIAAVRAIGEEDSSTGHGRRSARAVALSQLGR